MKPASLRVKESADVLHPLLVGFVPLDLHTGEWARNFLEVSLGDFDDMQRQALQLRPLFNLVRAAPLSLASSSCKVSSAFSSVRTETASSVRLGLPL